MAFVNDEWHIPDYAAAFLLADREICRRVFHNEPLDRVVTVIDWVLSEQDNLGPDLEGSLTRWAIEHNAGVYGPKRRQGDLVRIGDTLIHELNQGTLSWIELERPGLTHADSYRIYLKRVRDREKSIGRRLSPSELEQFTRAFNAPGYRESLEKISAKQWEELHAELEVRKPTDLREGPL